MSERDKWQAASERLAHYTEPKSDAQYRRDRALAARATALMASAPDAGLLNTVADVRIHGCSRPDCGVCIENLPVRAFLRAVAALLREEEGAA